jgi:hypothetical protein
VILTACTPDEEPEVPEVPGEEIEEKHEMLNWFVLEPDTEWGEKVFSSVTQMESNVQGNYPTYLDDGFHYVVQESINKYNELVKTLTVYKDGAAIITKEAKVDYQPKEQLESKDFYVEIDEDYIAIYVYVESEEKEELDETFELDLYKVSDTGSVLFHRTALKDFGKTGSALYVKTADKVEWVSENGTVIFSAPVDVYESYFDDNDYEEDRITVRSNAEYDGYVYWLGDSRITVYAPGGVASLDYNVPASVDYAYRYVLNDGNIVVQEFTYLDKWAEKYDTIYDGEKASVETKIINYKTGAVTVLENVDFIIADLESRYNYDAEESYFPFGVANGKDNQAVIIPMDKAKEPSFSNCQYVSIDNALTVKYTVPVKELNFAVEDAFWYGDMVVVSEDRYVASLIVGDETVDYFFDLDGNALANVDEVESSVKDYLITESAVYDWNMKLVYNFDYNKVEWCGVIGDNIVVAKDANFDGYAEKYFLDPATSALTAIDDGLNTQLLEAEYGIYSQNYYVVVEYCDACIAHLGNCDSVEGCDEYCDYEAPCQNCKCVLYNVNGEALLTARGLMYVENYDYEIGKLFVVTEFEGNYVWYVVE